MGFGKEGRLPHTFIRGHGGCAIFGARVEGGIRPEKKKGGIRPEKVFAHRKKKGGVSRSGVDMRGNVHAGEKEKFKTWFDSRGPGGGEYYIWVITIKICI